MTGYSTNLSNSQWQIISKFLDVKRSRKYSLREIINAIFYLIKTGCQWRMLPSDFPNWKLVYYYFSVWKRSGLIEYVHECLVEKTRVLSGKKEEPTLGIIDAQSVKNTLVSCEHKGFDAGKRIKGVKRHIIVDTLGLILTVVIHSASIQDSQGGFNVVERLYENCRRIAHLIADGGYNTAFVKGIRERFKLVVTIIKRSETNKFTVLPKRWIVERTFAWLDTNRRNAKYYERLHDTGVAVVHLAAIRIMLKRF